MGETHRIRKEFTRKDKKNRTILLCEMLEYHNVFLEAAFRAEGYLFEVLNNKIQDITGALKLISNDYCYPSVLIIAQFLEYMESRQKSPHEVAFMEPQANGACRAGNIYNLLQRVLYKKSKLDDPDYADIPVISLSFSKEESHSGFRITHRLLQGAISAVCYGDLIMCLYQQVKPFEVTEGKTDRVRQEVEKQLCESIYRHEFGKNKRQENYLYAVRAFAGVKVNRVSARKTVGITGEIYMKYSRLGNDNIEDFILKNGGAPYSGGFLNYCMFLVDSEEYKAGMYDGNSLKEKGCHAVLSYLAGLQKQLYDCITAHSDFYTDMPFFLLKEKMKGIIDLGCNTGDGWLIAAETVQYVERGCKSVLILHPFGCLVSHVCERGIMKRLHEKYPACNIETIEFDYDQSKTLRESRILMAL